MTNVYDVANWRPITPERFLEELCTAFMTADEPETITLTIDPTLPDGRSRIVVGAACDGRGTRPEDRTMEIHPYLMILHQPEGGKTHAFVRTDLELDLV